MISPSFAYKRYHSARMRFLKPALEDYFVATLSSHLGPVLREKLADGLLELMDQYLPPLSRLKPGQMLWRALDKRTRADSRQPKFVPVILTLVDDSDIQMLESETPVASQRPHAIARLYRQAYEQGGLLSTRDVALLLWQGEASVSKQRIKYELMHQCILPHTGALHDMGSTVTHKRQIVEKVVFEKKDPVAVARECHHSQRAVDKYLKDYQRVITAHDSKPDVDFIHRVTGIAPHVIKQYLEIQKHGTSTTHK